MVVSGHHHRIHLTFDHYRWIKILPILMSRVNQAVKSRDSQWDNIYFHRKVYIWTCVLFEVHLQPDQMKISPFLINLKNSLKKNRSTWKINQTSEKISEIQKMRGMAKNPKSQESKITAQESVERFSKIGFLNISTSSPSCIFEAPVPKLRA